jgi:type II secretory pathway predicted ATPase ExeA
MKDLRCFGSSEARHGVLEYYQLREQPFGDTADPRYLYLSATHRRALATLFYGIEAARGHLALTGKPGTGKTTLLSLLLKRLNRTTRTSFVFHTLCDGSGILRHLLANLGVPPTSQDPVVLQQQLREVVEEEARGGRRVLLVIDEAHHLEGPIFELIGRWLDDQGTKTGAPHVLLSGHPILAEKLTRPGMPHSKERAWIVTQLERLDATETTHYIDYRLRMAGYSGAGLFSTDAREMIAQCSQGIPREINMICFNALFRGYARKQESIDSAIVTDAVADLVLGQSVDPSAGSSAN